MSVFTSAYASMLLDPAGSKVSPIVTDARVIQADRAHDIAVLRIRGMDPTTPAFLTGTPVMVDYGWSPVDVSRFYGYVNHVVPEHRHDVHPSLATMYAVVVCVGASYGARDATSAAWMNAQVSSLIEGLAKKYRFSGTVEVGDPVWPQLSNPGTSDWRFASEQAAKLGWSLAVNQTHLRFMSLEKIVSRYTNTIPTFWTKTSAPDISFFTLNSFKVQQGETAHVDHHVKAIRVTSNVDRLLGEFTIESTPPAPLLAAASAAPVFHIFETDVPADSKGVAANALLGVHKDNRFYIQAEAVVAGNTKVTQAMPVLLLGLGSAHQGVWFVQRVEHHITADNYVCRLSLGRDGLMDNGLRPARSTDQARGVADINAFSSTVPSTVLINGGWRSSFYSMEEV